MKTFLACHDRFRRSCIVSWALLVFLVVSGAVHLVTGWPGLAMRFFWHCTRG
jgi:hypothetical protein